VLAIRWHAQSTGFKATHTCGGVIKVDLDTAFCLKPPCTADHAGEGMLLLFSFLLFSSLFFSLFSFLFIFPYSPRSRLIPPTPRAPVRLPVAFGTQLY